MVLNWKNWWWQTDARVSEGHPSQFKRHLVVKGWRGGRNRKKDKTHHNRLWLDPSVVSAEGETPVFDEWLPESVQKAVRCRGTARRKEQGKQTRPETFHNQFWLDPSVASLNLGNDETSPESKGPSPPPPSQLNMPFIVLHLHFFCSLLHKYSCGDHGLLASELIRQQCSLRISRDEIVI